MRYRDGSSIWSLHGVVVSRSIAETPAQSLDPRLLLTEKNAEIRREIVRKIGIERCLLKLGGKVLNKSADYSLVSIKMGDGRIRPYLKMLNPSIQTWHLEGVPPEIKTVKAALAWRNNTQTIPEILT